MAKLRKIYSKHYFIFVIPAYRQAGLTKRSVDQESQKSIGPNILIDTLITSKTRIKLLLKFFLNPDNSAHLRGLESEFGESSNAIRMELNRLEDADMLHSKHQGNRKLFKVNANHPLYNEINSIVKKYYGLDVIVEWIAKRLGNLRAVYLTGDIAKGKDAGLIDLILVGDIDQPYLLKLIQKAEKLIKRKIRYLIYTVSEFESSHERENGALLVWGEIAFPLGEGGKGD